ncbi:hypothetical protein ACFO5Q_06945 [Kordiimonas lipolytica]|uniref:Uncharacterized protein n=1 Tax=Kordiimonas lipolytica TaxID=1662421 RepID=A0ABV8U9S2_9PROT|nr:hypothetical protein [Kordiimonas lipolytica]
MNILIFILMFSATADTAEGSVLCGKGYATVGEAMAYAHALDGGGRMPSDEFLLYFEESDTGIQQLSPNSWYITLPGHPAHPAVACTSITKAESHEDPLQTDFTLVCEGEKTACRKLDARLRPKTLRVRFN